MINNTSKSETILLDRQKIIFTEFWYSSVDSLNIQGFCIKPASTDNNGPVVILNRGGSKDFGLFTKENLLDFFIVKILCESGYTIICSNLRGNSISGGVDEFGGRDLDDLLELKNCITQLNCGNIDKIAVLGGSRGGLMTYLMLEKVKWIRAAIVIGALADFGRSLKERPETRQYWQSNFDLNEKEVQKRSPILHTNCFAINTPILIMHGADDHRVNPLDSLEMCQELLKQHIVHKLIIFEGGSHDLAEYEREVINQIDYWLNKYLPSN
jgi:dipeptidyl aminopeptidase/acylaminoacyl peptidase